MKVTTLVVLAHPEPASFNGRWARSTRRISESLGHRVLFSDLVSMGFDPVERRQHYAGLDARSDTHAAVFDPLDFQHRAAATGMLPQDVVAELEKIRAADRLILHFPLWWFGPPAILKGWIDRCLVHGALHSAVRRFDTGICRHKKALFCVTTGSSAEESSRSGREADARLLLWPLAYALRYVGFTLLQPVFVHGVHGYHDPTGNAAMTRRLRAALSAHGQLLSQFESLPVIRYNPDGEFDERGQLRADATAFSPFILPNA